MSTRRPLRPLLALAAAAALSVGLMGSAVAQDATASPPPTIDASAEQVAERKAAREERKAERDARKAERAASRDARKAERSVAREEREEQRAAAREQRVELKAAWNDVRDDCTAEFEAVRGNDELDRAARRDALGEARATCGEMLAVARDEYRAASPAGTRATASDGTGVVRTDLGIAEPGSAPGEELGLWHYLIPAQTDLPAHTHPGWQLARVVRGQLEYTVIEGEGVLLRGDTSEPMGPGTYVLETGDGVIENPDLVHEASNRKNRPVIIISATLFPAGAEISTLVDQDPAPRDDEVDDAAAVEEGAEAPDEAPDED